MILVASGYMNDHMNGRRTILKRKKMKKILMVTITIAITKMVMIITIIMELS